METIEEYKLLLEFFGQPIEQMEWKYFEEKKFNCLHKASFHSVSDNTVHHFLLLVTNIIGYQQLSPTGMKRF